MPTVAITAIVFFDEEVHLPSGERHVGWVNVYTGSRHLVACRLTMDTQTGWNVLAPSDDRDALANPELHAAVMATVGQLATWMAARFVEQCHLHAAADLGSIEVAGHA